MAFGCSLSVTTTVCVTSIAALPFISVTFHLIVVVPTGYNAVNSRPSLRTPVTAPTEQLSVALALTVTVAPHTPGSVLTVLSPLVVITGFSLSVTTTVCVTSIAALPFTSVTFHLIVVVPTGYNAVNARPSLRTPVTAPTEQLSVALALTVTVAPHTPGSVFTVLSPLVVITGLILSSTFT